MDIENAVRALKSKCEECGYEPNKVDALYKQMLSGKLYFAYFPDIEADGLINDIETQAIPVARVFDTYDVEMLEAAEKFFKKRPCERMGLDDG